MTDREGGACTPVRDRRAESTHWFDGQLDCIGGSSAPKIAVVYLQAS